MKAITLSEDDVGLQASRTRNLRVPSPSPAHAERRSPGRVLVYSVENRKLPLVRGYLEERGAEVEVRPYPECTLSESIDQATMILLSVDTMEAQASDALVMTNLLKLRSRDLEASVVAEILDPENIELMWTARADDCIASYQLSASVLTQAAYHPELLRVIGRLLEERGVRLKIRPVSDYMAQGTFQHLTLRAMAHGEIPLGYFPDDMASPVINPAKGATVPVSEAKAILLEPIKT